MDLSSHSSSKNPLSTLARALLFCRELQPLKGSEQSPGRPHASTAGTFLVFGVPGKGVWQHRAGRQGAGAEPVGCCLKPHSGDPPLSFQFVPISSPAPPLSTLTMATSAGRPMPTSATTPASSRPCRTTAPRPWGPKVCDWPGGPAP